MVDVKKGKIKCAFCRGTGTLPKRRTMDINCPACRGEGFVYFDQAVACPFCKSKGRDPLNYELPCQVCGGIGATEVKKGFKICPDCQGRGKKKGQYLSCVSCKGKGVVER